MNELKEIIQKSGLSFLDNIQFEEKTPGRFFQNDKIDLGNGLKQFYVILMPEIESPVHNHKGQNMDETHMLLYGSGKFIIYGDSTSVKEEIILELGKFHKIFSTRETTPNHKYIAGNEGSITLAIEKHYN